MLSSINHSLFLNKTQCNWCARLCWIYCNAILLTITISIINRIIFKAKIVYNATVVLITSNKTNKPKIKKEKSKKQSL